MRTRRFCLGSSVRMAQEAALSWQLGLDDAGGSLMAARASELYQGLKLLKWA